MMAITAEQFKEAARKAAAAGDMATAKSLIAKAKAAESALASMDATKAGLSEAFRSATVEREGPPIPENILLRERARGRFADMGAGMAAAGGMAQGGTFGLADEILARVQSVRPDVTYDQALAVERGRLDAARESHPVAAFGGELVGAMAVPLGVSQKAVTTGGKITAGALTGATGGGIYGFGSGEGGFGERSDDGLQGAVIGGALGAAIPGVGALVQKALVNRATNRMVRDLARGAPTSDELKEAGSAAYKAIDGAGVEVLPGAMRTAADKIVASMRASGLDEAGGALNLTPKSARVAQLLDEAGKGNGPIAFGKIDQLRRKAGIPASDIGNKVEQQLGAKAISGLDDMVNGLTPDQVTAGDLETLQTMLPKARDLWARMSRSQLLDDAIEAGESYVSGAGSGIRNQFARIIRNPKLRRSFSEAELKVMRRVASGTIPEKMLHLAGGGIGNILAMGGGLFGGGMPGATIGTGAAIGLRKASEAVTRRNAEIARGLVASGGMRTAPQIPPNVAELIVEQLLQRGLRPTYPAFGQAPQGQPTPR